VDNFIQLKYDESFEFINKYEVFMNLRTTLRFKTNFDIFIYLNYLENNNVFIFLLLLPYFKSQ